MPHALRSLPFLIEVNGQPLEGRVLVEAPTLRPDGTGYAVRVSVPGLVDTSLYGGCELTATLFLSLIHI